jgi:hypothetical protein
MEGSVDEGVIALRAWANERFTQITERAGAAAAAVVLEEHKAAGATGTIPLDPNGGYERPSAANSASESSAQDIMSSFLSLISRSAQSATTASLADLLSTREHSGANHPAWPVSGLVFKQIADGHFVSTADATQSQPNAGGIGRSTAVPKKFRVVPTDQASGSSRIRTVTGIMGETIAASPRCLRQLASYERFYNNLWLVVSPAGVFAIDTVIRNFWAQEFLALPPGANPDFAVPQQLSVDIAILLSLHQKQTRVPPCSTCGAIECSRLICPFAAPAAAPSSSPLSAHSRALSSASSSSRRQQDTCNKFNGAAGCTSTNCRYLHACAHCGRQGHSKSSCFKLNPPPRSPRDPPDGRPTKRRTTDRSPRAPDRSRGGASEDNI